MRRLVTAALLAMVISTPAPAADRMNPGDLRLGAGLGLRSTYERLTFSAGASFGVFIVPELEPGLDLNFQTGADSPTLLALSGTLRWVILTYGFLSPYLRVGGGRGFLLGLDDAWMLSAGGGQVFWIGQWYGLDLEVSYHWTFSDETIGKFDIRFGLMFVL